MVLFLDAIAKVLKLVVINDVSKKRGSFKGIYSCRALLFDITGKNSKVRCVIFKALAISRLLNQYLGNSSAKKKKEQKTTKIK